MGGLGQPMEAPAPPLSWGSVTSETLATLNNISGNSEPRAKADD
jgi:hypothetical protein